MKKIIFSSRPSSKKSKGAQKTPKGPIKGDYLIVALDQNGNEMTDLPSGLIIGPSVKGQLSEDVTKISLTTKTRPLCSIAAPFLTSLALGMGVFLSFFDDRNLPRNGFCSIKIYSYDSQPLFIRFFSKL